MDTMEKLTFIQKDNFLDSKLYSGSIIKDVDCILSIMRLNEQLRLGVRQHFKLSNNQKVNFHWYFRYQLIITLAEFQVN